MKFIFTLVTAFLIGLASASAKKVFSGEWTQVKLNATGSARKDGKDYKFYSYVFKNKVCQLKFKSKSGEVYLIECQFIADDKRLCLIHGKDLSKASVEFFEWQMKDGILTLTRHISAEEIRSNPPNVQNLDPEIADLTLMLHEKASKEGATITQKFKR